MNGMTIKQIAEVAGVDERTVRRWAEKATDILPVIADKMSASSPVKPSKYALNETLEIIRAGNRGTLADLLTQNAEAPPQNADVQQVVFNKISAAKLRECRLAAQNKLISKEQFQYLIGVGAAPQPVTMLPVIVSKEEEAAREIARRILAKRKRDREDEKEQAKLPGFDAHDSPLF